MIFKTSSPGNQIMNLCILSNGRINLKDGRKIRGIRK
jgi:hypothetical protein